ncbi:MAG: helix-turn-helix transcriptional regulator [Clostridia bacterium]|nr:helix-turn-helix transcriptional regulator [Clostridia bacterium]
MLTRIKEFRKKLNMTQETLAELTGLTQGQIVRIEQGKTDIGLEQLTVFANALGVKPTDLLPAEWQPQPITPAEQQILDMIRKTTTADNAQTETPKAE